MENEQFKDVNTQIENSMGVKPQRGRWLSDIDDYESKEFPQMSAQDYIAAVKAGTHHFPEHLDTVARDKFGEAIMGELGLSPSDFNEIFKNDPNAGTYTEDFVDEYNRWKAWNSRPQWAKQNPYFNYEKFGKYFNDKGQLIPETQSQYLKEYSADPVVKALRELGNIGTRSTMSPYVATKIKQLNDVINNAPIYNKFRWDYDRIYAPDAFRKYYRKKWRNL